jgi:RNA polymerase sigma factor (sigma-70 family)
MPPPAEGFASRLFLGPALRTQPDRRLVTFVREGYETAFEEIVRRYGSPLSRYAASIVGGRSEDVTQDAFSKALLALRRDDAEIELRPWLFRIVRNTALNDLRDSPPSPEVLAEAIAGGANPAEELERREELADLIKRLQALPEPQRAAIVMRELEGLGHEEIAAALGLTGGGARQAIYRARQALRDGAGMLIPLPLLQALLAGGGSGVTETAGMGAAGIGGATGAGIALKATAATVLVAGAGRRRRGAQGQLARRRGESGARARVARRVRRRISGDPRRTRHR